MNRTALKFFTENQLGSIGHAIASAEKMTSGEIRLHVEEKCIENDVLERAAQVFALLKMHKTEQRNGVLIYLAFKDRKFAIIGDAGINKVVEPGFWDSVRDIMKADFSQGEFTDGLIKGIELAGEKLKAFFPCLKDDKNEITDEVSAL